MRGKPHARLPLTPPSRNIPAYAGKTLRVTKLTYTHEEHPRVCGENDVTITDRKCAVGTSPRMRGKLSSPWPMVWTSRNIPAYAGKTPPRWFPPGCLPEHPRVCGENPPLSPPRRATAGTSPRMRGKRFPTHRQQRKEGNIPAYAGKTNPGHSLWHYGEEHPRVCGENVSSSASVVYATGTSPRMRGKRKIWPGAEAWYGNIPAYAGKTAARTLLARRTKEHPRVCGENRLDGHLNNRVRGTSPRMRGKQGAAAAPPCAAGNIPAYAGKTCACDAVAVVFEEHPRVCGENGCYPVSIEEVRGTSPRMRGKRVRAMR